MVSSSQKKLNKRQHRQHPLQEVPRDHGIKRADDQTYSEYKREIERTKHTGNPDYVDRAPWMDGPAKPWGNKQIVGGCTSPEYRKGWERIFGKPKVKHGYKGEQDEQSSAQADEGSQEDQGRLEERPEDVTELDESSRDDNQQDCPVSSE